MNPMKRILLFSLLVLTFSTTAAQDDDTSGWPVEQRCVGAPTTPPEGWTFEGTILMTGYAGIHAIQADWETPHIATFIRPDQTRMGLPPGLSPDKRWLATFEGRTFHDRSITLAEIVVVERLRVSSISQRAEAYILNLDSLPPLRSPMRWWTNETLIYQSEENELVEINPFNGEIVSQRFSEVSATWLIGPSPDWTRYVAPTTNDRDDQMWAVYGTESGGTLSPFTPFRHSAEKAIWLPDSSGFAAIIPLENHGETLNQIALFDRDGDFIETIVTLGPLDPMFNYPSTGIYSLYVPATWSPDGRLLAFITHADSTLRIADRQERRVTSTCMHARYSVAWSPDSAAVGFIGESPGQSTINVLDLDRWRVFIAGYQDGAVFAWLPNG
jgi:WD40 repeat protein